MSDEALQSLARSVHAAFTAQYGEPPTALVQAPGRVNLIGEHTDYNDGFVLPCAIGFATVVALRPRAERRIRVLAIDQGMDRDEIALDQPVEHRADRAAARDWADYVRGMVAMVQGAHGALPGADLAIGGNVPMGAGLSSSASLEVAVGQALKQLAGLDRLDSTALALLAQRAENDFVGCRCGVMDQLVSARGQAGHALLIDYRSLQVQPVRIPSGLSVLIVHSNLRRELADSAATPKCRAAVSHWRRRSL